VNLRTTRQKLDFIITADESVNTGAVGGGAKDFSIAVVFEY
jgi:hypothetical protein